MLNRRRQRRHRQTTKDYQQGCHIQQSETFYYTLLYCTHSGAERTVFVHVMYNM